MNIFFPFKNVQTMIIRETQATGNAVISIVLFLNFHEIIRL